MRELVVGGFAAIAVALTGAPMAQAHPCSPEPVCHEFDWAIPYYDALKNHGIGHLTKRGIPVALAAEALCKSASVRSVHQRYADYLSLAEAEQVAQAVHADVCPEARP